MVFKLAAEFLHDADGRHRGGVAERAEGAAQHVLRELAHHVDVFGTAEARVEALQHFAQPNGSFAAGNAPAAGFVRVEVHDAARHVYHAGVFVHHHHAARAEHAASFGNRVVVHRQIDFVRGHQRAGAAAGNHRFQLLAVGNAAGHLVDELFHVHAERNFVDARLVDMARYTEQACSTILRRATVRVGFSAILDDGWDGAERLDIINNRWAAVETNDSREGRLDAWIAALALERFHQSRFLAAFIGASAGVNQQIVIETATENVFAEVATLVGFRDGFVHQIKNVAVFAANINEAAMRSDGSSRN